MEKQDELLFAEFEARKKKKILISEERIEAQNRAFAERLRLNSELSKNKYWCLPVNDVEHVNYMPVGRGVKSSDICARCVGLLRCPNVEGHKAKVFDGVDCTGKAAVRLRHWWCHKSSCPVCFIRGWAVDEARSIVSRLDVAVKHGLGKIEHITVSVPEKDRDLEESVLRIKCRRALLDRGVEGGCMIFHGYRIDREINMLSWSPHHHCLGVVRGGFDRCRNCSLGYDFCARSCNGLKGREIRGFKEDGYLVKVHDEVRVFSARLGIS